MTSSIGAGHVSVARTLKKTLEQSDDEPIQVEVVDLLTTLKNIAATATKKIYLGSLALSPKIYRLFYQHETASEWTLKFLNAISAPFMEDKLLALLREKKPTLLVSTYPVWHHLIKKVWKKYCSQEFGEARPFASVVTDSVQVHDCWTHGRPDYFFVGNEDTRAALEHRGVPAERIHVLGYPVSPRFEKLPSHAKALRSLKLRGERTTLLLILSSGQRWRRIKRLTEALRNMRLPNIQMVAVVTNPRWRAKLAAVRFGFPVRIFGWTDDMPRLFSASDIVLTKAGGATVMECIAAEKPMIILESLPGQEAGNVMLVRKYYLGAVLDGEFSRLESAIETVQREKSLIAKNLRGQQKHGAAVRIAKALSELADGSCI